MAYIVNSLPRPGLRYAASQTFENAVDALLWAGELDRRGMHRIRIVDTRTSVVHEEAGLRAALRSSPA